MAGRKPVRLQRMTTARSRLCSSAVARIALWNALAFAAASCAVVASAEAYLRLTWPFRSTTHVTELVPGVGVRFKPHSEVRSTNTLDWWTVQRANSIGFLDREPLSPQRAAASCHVAVVGDSYVEANEVQVSDKLQVRLEQMAAERLPGWDVTVSAYGHHNTGQVAQLPWWDEWIGHRSPKLVVLVFTPNDFGNNGRSPMHGVPFAHARADQDGRLELIAARRVPEPGPPSHPFDTPPPWGFVPDVLRPYVGTWIKMRLPMLRANLSPVFPSLDRRDPFVWPQRSRDRTFTAFALDEWKKNTQEAGSSLVILSGFVATRSPNAASMLDYMERLASARDIPAIDQMDHILARGGDPYDAHWPNDPHWSPQGHQWAAEALLDWLAANLQTCES